MSGTEENVMENIFAILNSSQLAIIIIVCQLGAFDVVTHSQALSTTVGLHLHHDTHITHQTKHTQKRCDASKTKQRGEQQVQKI